jgi:hypothetical protein
VQPPRPRLQPHALRPQTRRVCASTPPWARCYRPTLTIAAALGYRSPFLCPLGKEREADACKQQLAAGSESDHVALANAYDGWLHAGRARFAAAHFLSHLTLGYVHRCGVPLPTPHPAAAFPLALLLMPAPSSLKHYSLCPTRLPLALRLMPPLPRLSNMSTGAASSFARASWLSGAAPSHSTFSHNNVGGAVGARWPVPVLQENASRQEPLCDCRLRPRLFDCLNQEPDFPIPAVPTPQLHLPLCPPHYS